MLALPYVMLVRMTYMSKVNQNIRQTLSGWPADTRQRVQDCLPMDVATHLACIVSKSFKCDSHIRSDQLPADQLWSSGKN